GGAALGEAGMCLIATDRRDEGAALGRRAIDELRALHERAPDSAEVAGALAEACANLGCSVSKQGMDDADAEGLLRESVATYDDLAKRDALGRLWQGKAANARWMLGQELRYAGKYAEGLEWARASVQQLEPLVQRFPEVTWYRRNLAAALTTVTGAALGVNDPDEARRAAERALHLFEEIRDADPAHDEYYVASSRFHVAVAAAGQGKYAEAHALA